MSNKNNEQDNTDEIIIEEQEVAADEVNQFDQEAEIGLTGEDEMADEAIIESLENKVAELENAVLKEKAEVENFKRRMKQEYDTNLKFASQSLIEKMLPILDGFDRALESVDKADEATVQFTKGFQMIQTLLDQILSQEGLTIIPAVGQKFDPHVHQAVLSDSIEGIADEEILEELQKGYKLKDRVVRATMVKVNNIK